MSDERFRVDVTALVGARKQIAEELRRLAADVERGVLVESSCNGCQVRIRKVSSAPCAQLLP